jgi:hypothetical protein
MRTTRPRGDSGEAEFLAPPPHLVTDEDRHRHRHSQRRILITERNERLMQQWWESFPSDGWEEEEFYATKKKERRVDRRHRQEFAEAELENPNSPENFDSDGPMWNDLWTETTSNDDE